MKILKVQYLKAWYLDISESERYKLKLTNQPYMSSIGFIEFSRVMHPYCRAISSFPAWYGWLGFIYSRLHDVPHYNCMSGGSRKKVPLDTFLIANQEWPNCVFKMEADVEWHWQFIHTGRIVLWRNPSLLQASLGMASVCSRQSSKKWWP